MSTTSMVLFDHMGVLRTYESAEQILKEFFTLIDEIGRKWDDNRQELNKLEATTKEELWEHDLGSRSSMKWRRPSARR